MEIAQCLRIIHYAAIVGFFFLLVYSYGQKQSEMQKHITILTIASILMLAGYIIEVDAQCLEVALMGISVSYLGKPFIMLSSFLLISSFYDIRIPQKAVTALFWYSALLPAIVYTNPYHHLYYATIEYCADASYTPVVITRGPLYILNVLTSACFFIGCISVIVKGYRRSQSPTKRRLSIYSICMVLFGVVGYALYLMGFTNGYDSTVLGVSLGAFFLGILFFRCRIFDVVNTAKDYALDASADGLIVYDDANMVAYENNAANRFRNEKVTPKQMTTLQEGKNTVYAGDNVYAVTQSSITYKNEYLGKSVEIHDITESYHYQQNLETAVRETTERLSGLQRSMLASLASIVEARSLETGDHIRRVSTYANGIAQVLKTRPQYCNVLTDAYIRMLVLTAPLHDVGKISVRDSVLQKPGKLTDEEFEEMKLHTTDGYKVIHAILKGLESEEYIQMAAQVALYHHEWWNGTGYPMALRAEQIPLAARIVAVADCYDAITSKRCYKESMSDTVARRILQEESGTHFEPEIVDAFFEYLDGTEGELDTLA